MIAALLIAATLAAPLTSQDWQREAVFAALLVADWRQTQDIRRHPGRFELNPILGRRPSLGRVDRYFAASLLAHAACSLALRPEYRVTYQRATIAAEAVVVGRNAYLGLEIRF